MARTHTSGIWQRLRQAFSGRQSSPRRGAPRHRLGRFEPLEQRRLLALTDMGVISGTVFLDVDGDGFGAGTDTPIENVNVQLYKDDGNNAFESGVDTPVGSTTTDADGAYLFTDLTADTYWVYQVPDPAQQTVENVQQVIITAADAAGTVGTYIDQFSGGNAPNKAKADVADVPAYFSTDDPGAVGGERDSSITIDAIGSNDSIAISVSATNGWLSVNGPAGGGNWTARATWDGDDGDAINFNPTGLRDPVTSLGVDLTNGGFTEGLTFNAGTDKSVGTDVVWTFYTDATHYSAVTLHIDQTTDGLPEQTLFVDFNILNDIANAAANGVVIGPGGAVDVADIGAIELEIVSSAATDVVLEWVGSVGPTIQTVNFQNYQPLTLGNLVFEDLNNNGVFDSASESGIEGVGISLWLDANANGTLDGSGIDTQIGSVFTDAAGLYQFTDLFPGDYIAQIGTSNFDVGGPLRDYAVPPGAIDPDVGDVDNDNNGLMLVGPQVLSAPITLTVDGEAGADLDTNLTLDFGFVPTIDLRVNKVVTNGATTVDAGDSFSYTITVTNDGPHAALDVVLVDTLPAGITLDTTTPSYDSYDLGTREITFNLGDLAPLATRNFQINVTADVDASGLLTNSAVVSTTTFEADTSNNTSEADITSRLVADLAISKTDTPDPLLPGETLTYTITVTNNGPSTATDVTVVDTLPAGVTFVSASPAQTSYDSVTREVTVGVPNLADGGSDTVTIVTTVDAGVVGTITNAALVTTSQNDLNPANDTTTEDTTVDPIYGVALTKDVSHATATAGTMLTYTIDVDNIGTGNTTGVTIVDTLPTGVTFVSASGASVTDVTGQQVTLDLGSLAAGGTQQVTVRATIDSSATGTLTNTATVSLVETENGGNTAVDNTDTAETIVQIEVDLAIDKQVSDTHILPGEALTYTLVVTNNGPSDATNVTVVDVLPEEVIFDFATGATEIYDSIAHDVTFDIGTLTAGASNTLTIDALVESGLDPAITPNFTNAATVSASEPETDLTNNTDQAIVSLQLENASIAGMVFLDFANDGIFNGNDIPLRRVEVTLAGTDVFGRQIQRATRTASDGIYLFDDLSPGNYTVNETQPASVLDGKDTVGTSGGNANDDAIAQINLEGGINAINYTFAERLPSKRRFLASS